MYESLHDHTPDFHLYIFAFDELTHEILLNFKLDKVTVVSLNEFETDELKAVKEERSIAEYCWTCTPSVISYVLNKYDVSDCTYVDADLFFYSDPSVLISELSGHSKDTLITEHRFSFLPRLYEEKRGGRFCVQFMTFMKTESSLKVLDKWRRQCIQWCYARYEDNKFGDQKYLEEWPSIYQNIHILEHNGGGIAPWNIGQFRFYKDGKSIRGRVRRSGEDFDVVFYHFQYVKFLVNGSYDIGWYIIPTHVRNTFYVPYILKIEEIEKRLKSVNVKYHTGFTNFRAGNLKDFLKAILKNVFAYNILRIR